jgi:acetyl esterase
MNARTVEGTPAAVAQVEDITIPGPGGQIPLRIYTPAGTGPFPLLIYLHGGGWVFGTLDQSDNVCRYFTSKVGCIVISVDYRLAPKHKFPAAVEDAYGATQWAAENAKRIKGDPARIAIGGASAGGNLAAVVCLMAKDRSGPSLVFQLLAYPPTNIATLETASYRDFARGHGLGKSHVKWYRKQYLANEEDAKNAYASPLLADDLSNLPPALVLTGEFDVLRDEGEAYAKRLKQEGVPARYIRYANMGHIAHWTIESDQAGDALHQAALALDDAFSQ